VTKHTAFWCIQIDQGFRALMLQCFRASGLQGFTDRCPIPYILLSIRFASWGPSQQEENVKLRT